MKLFRDGQPFLRGNLHMHTTNSDGRLSPDAAVSQYAAKGYDFIALTDHWVAAPERTHAGMLVMSGVELDTTLEDQFVHIVGIGVDPDAINGLKKQMSECCTPQLLVNAALDAGGRAILAHPAWSLNTTELMQSLDGLAAAEIYNAFSGEPWNGERSDSSALLDLLATRGTLLGLVASDDAHHYTGEAGRGFTMVQAEDRSREAILDALDRGAFYASEGPRFHQIEYTDEGVRVSCSPVERVTFYSNRPWAKKRCKIGHAMTEAFYQLDQEDWPERYIRVVLTDAFGRRAWSSPVAL